MLRSKIPQTTLENVLVSSRRRCAICYGLNRDTSLKLGQVAHLDHVASNNVEDNLVYLCLEHHDKYDSRTSQSKNYTMREIKVFRRELLGDLEPYLSKNAFDTETVAREAGVVDGHYIRTTDGDGEFQSAEIKISKIVGKHNEYSVSGFALWGKRKERGPNTGEFQIIMSLKDNIFRQINCIIEKCGYSINIKVDGQSLVVDEKNWSGKYGMNVNFQGNYKKSN